MFKNVLIANRGEIACRISKTLHKLQLKSIAIYSDADKNSLHRSLATQSVHIGAAPPADSYLNIDKIIACAKEVGAEAIHPGYGFLAENSNFAKACEVAGIEFIGPPSNVIDIMAAKSESKKIMQQHGVPILTNMDATNTDKIKSELPILIKATYGGGGKGMRIVNSAAEYSDALLACKREALAHTGSDAVTIEKYLAKARHVEIQIATDKHGNVVHLFARDCSIQRRYQKIIEEAPAALSSTTLQKMTKVAMHAAAKIGYVGVGTFEFLLENDSFYFMEMNTRLQVEHPVTEKILDIDLVELQIKISQGQRIDNLQSKLIPKGHSIEARLYCEDPTNNYLPATGIIEHLTWPKDCRIDYGIKLGDNIDIYYDPMVAKIICWGTDRQEAINKLCLALGNTHLIGVTTNLNELNNILINDTFIKNEHYTSWLENNKIEVIDDKIEIALVAVTLSRLAPAANNIWQHNKMFRLNSSACLQINWFYNKENYTVIVDASAHETTVTIPASGNSYKVESYNFIDIHQFKFSISGNAYYAYICYFHDYYYCCINGQRFNISLLPENNLEEVEFTGNITSPITGVICKVLVATEDKVAANTPVIILEAMKMEHTITTKTAGTIKNICKQEGNTVHAGDTLISLE